MGQIDIIYLLDALHEAAALKKIQNALRRLSWQVSLA